MHRRGRGGRRTYEIGPFCEPFYPKFGASKTGRANGSRPAKKRARQMAKSEIRKEYMGG